MRINNKKILTIKLKGLTWQVLPENVDRLKKEIIPAVFETGELFDLSPIKKTDTRLVTRCHPQNSEHPLIVKVFKRSDIGSKIKSFFRPSRSGKEWKIGHKLSKRSLSTPPLVASGTSRKFGLLQKDYIISREIIGAKPLNVWIEENIHRKSISYLEKKEIIHAFALFVRLVHDKGIYPSDFHQGNVLIKIEKDRPPEFYLIDLHSIRIKRKLRLNHRIKNLVQLNDFQISTTDRLRFLKSYLSGKGIKGIPVKTFAKRIGKKSLKDWNRLWAKRKRKNLKPNKFAKIFEINSWVGMIQNDTDFFQTFQKINFSAQESGVKNIKNTPSVAVKELALTQSNESRCFIIKKYLQIGWVDKIKAVVRTSRAKRCWINAHNLLMRGISTPRPIAFAEKKRLGRVRESFFMSEKLPGAQASDLFLADPSKRSFLKQEFLFNLARQVRWMHQTNICHGDLKASNILVVLHEQRPGIFFVDLDGVKVCNSIRIKDIAKDLSRMKAAFSDILAQSQMEYFFRVYGRDNTFFQSHKKKIMEKVDNLTMKKIEQKRAEVRRLNK